VDTYHRGSVRGKEPTLGRKHTHYSSEFRAEAVRLAETSSHSIRQVAMELGISNESLARWMRGARTWKGPVGPVKGIRGDWRTSLSGSVSRAPPG
jgi:transposase-like protein